MAAMKKVQKQSLNWTLTLKVRLAVQQRRIIVSPHALDRAESFGIRKPDIYRLLSSGVVLGKKEKDEQGTATDGYKHFLHGLLENGMLVELVVKFVNAISYPGEELVVLITILRRKL
ncbi:MAG: DUF4258 domain-containing protein [Planctomycetes bacterium]|nr:DUF4258 domain-containing protein [Planctomycetota bacterium]